ncbi:carboxypeptidase regulatory-like domain-containing protein [Clostridium botulinum]|nr:carboxypeptidase regulatory-like domain-containing protein [Clostridium botulinum]
MPSVSGQVLFNSVNTSPTTGNIITSGVQIVLVKTTSNVGLIIKSDSSGNYVFNNVPAGNYKIVETFGTATTLTSPGDFNTAEVFGTINPNDPPITAMPSPPAQANIVQSLTPNTISITVGTLNITGQNFVDAPTQDIHITKLDLSLIGSNILTGANNGTWGSWAPGTAQATAPYPLSVPGFTYVLSSSTLP